MESYLIKNFGDVKVKHSSEEALRRWRNICWLVKNRKRRFRFTANSKRNEAEAMRRSEEKFRVVGLALQAALHFIHGPPLNDVCSICHGHFSVLCQSNCSHWFCGSCIMRSWDHGSQLRPCRCPLCSRKITLLVPSKASVWQRRGDGDVASVLTKVERYNHTFAGIGRGIFQRGADLPFFIRRLTRELVDPQRSLHLVIRARIYITMILIAIYVISPVDLIPEGVVVIFGLLDDLLVLLIFFFHIAAVYRSFLHRRHGGQ